MNYETGEKLTFEILDEANDYVEGENFWEIVEVVSSDLWIE